MPILWSHFTEDADAMREKGETFHAYIMKVLTLPSIHI